MVLDVFFLLVVFGGVRLGKDWKGCFGVFFFVVFSLVWSGICPVVWMVFSRDLFI